MSSPPPRDDWDRTQHGKPIKVDGGLRVRSTRGEIARTWWSRRFIEVLESFVVGGRMASGRRYARAGQVLNLALSTSIVVATVQGSRLEPYKVRIAVKKFTDSQWSRVEQELAGQALYAAKLLAGQMPDDIEDVFYRLGMQLFPDTMSEITMDCSCPDWEIPCKHLAATFYLLAESFDTDPFQILAWRGRDRAQLLERLRELRAPGEPVESDDDHEPYATLAQSLDCFWGNRNSPLTPADRPATPPDALLDQLDPLPLALGPDPVVDLLRPAYRMLAERD